MNEKTVNLTNPKEVIRELHNTNKDIVIKFSDKFSVEIIQFSENFTAAFKEYLQIWRIAEHSRNKQTVFVSVLTYLILENLFTSMKLLMKGYQTPSGNLMRQVIEGIGLVTLVALKENITYKEKGKIKELNFFNSFMNDESIAQAHNAFKLLEQNIDNLNISPDSLEVFKESRKVFHKYSHPCLTTLATTLGIEDPGKTFIGGSFDPGKLDIYKTEIEERNNLCKVLPDIINWLLLKVRDIEH